MHQAVLHAGTGRYVRYVLCLPGPATYSRLAQVTCRFAINLDLIKKHRFFSLQWHMFSFGYRCRHAFTGQSYSIYIKTTSFRFVCRFPAVIPPSKNQQDPHKNSTRYNINITFSIFEMCLFHNYIDYSFIYFERASELHLSVQYGRPNEVSVKQINKQANIQLDFTH